MLLNFTCYSILDKIFLKYGLLEFSNFAVQEVLVCVSWKVISGNFQKKKQKTAPHISNSNNTIFTPPEKALGAHFHAQHGVRIISVFLPADGEASWSLFPNLVSILTGGTMQPENTNSCILKVTGQVWEIQKRISSNINHSYHQCSS